jgi:hypothetical protein
MSTDTEHRLRAALRAGATVITEDTPPALRSAGPQRRSITWPLLVAAAVVVLVVAVLAVVVRGSGSKHTSPPVHPSPPPAIDQLHPKTCTIPVPQAWQDVLEAGTIGDTPEPEIRPILGATSGGSVVATDLNRHQVVIVTPNHAVHHLYTAPTTVPGQGRAHIGSAAIGGDWVAVTLILGGGQGATGGIVAVNVHTGAVRVVRDPSLGSDSIVQPPAVLDGVVYWSEGPSVGPDHVYAYDLATQHRSTLDRSRLLDIGGPVVVGGGVYWQKAGSVVAYRPGNLPPGFVVEPGELSGALVTAGDRQAWVQQVGRRFVVKMRIGERSPVSMSPPTTFAPGITGIAGPYLVSGTTVLDTRTGAETTLVAGPDQLANAAAAGSTIAVNFTGSKGGPQLSLLDASALPELHC